jgi:hypothetical protein
MRSGRRTFFGHELPGHIVHVETRHVAVDDQRQVGWITAKGEKHSMPLETTEDGILAVIVAMKLTC